MTLALTLAARLAASAGTPVPHLNDMRRPFTRPGTPAAVLIAVTDRAEPGLILTQRQDTMRRHAGQVAFPGGRIDATDADPVAAALREAEEEIALPPGAVEVVGALDPYATVTGYDIVPVLGVIGPDLAFVPNADEVAAVFEVPLALLTDAANFGRRTIDYQGEARSFLEFHWHDQRIWGATAAMLVNLGARLR